MSDSEKHNHANHGHEHKHDHDLKSVLGAPAAVPEAPPAAGGESVLEDSGSRALSEALRSSFVIVKIVMFLLVALFLVSGIFTVPSQQKAIVLRFGRPVGEGDQQLLGPGLHWSFPRPIDEVVRIPIGELQTVKSTAGWFATTPGLDENQEPPAMPSLNPTADGYTLTADANIIHVRATLRYRITKPLNYVLNFVSASNVVQNALDNALFHASSFFTVDQALTSDKLGFRDTVSKRVSDIVEENQLGISVEQVDIDVREPRYLRAAFSQVTEAAVERRKAVDEARAYQNRVSSRAEGEAKGIVNGGETDRTRLIQAVASEAQYFRNQLEHYSANPQLFKSRLQAETIARIMTNAQDKMFIPANEELRVQINREPPKPKQQGQQQQQGAEGGQNQSR